MSAKQLEEISGRLARLEVLLVLLMHTEGIDVLTIEKTLAQLDIDAQSAEYRASVKRLQNAMAHKEWMGQG